MLLVERDGLQRLLNDSTSVHLQGQGLDVGPQLRDSQCQKCLSSVSEAHLVDQLVLLLGRPELEELLYDVVAEDVGHETVGG